MIISAYFIKLNPFMEFKQEFLEVVDCHVQGFKAVFICFYSFCTTIL